MFEFLKKLGVSGMVGALVGIALVVWIEPTTNAGMGLIVFVCIVLANHLRSRHSRLGGWQ